MLVCEEVGTAYLDPNDLETAIYGALDDPNCRCPRCSTKRISEFESASSEQIQLAGFPVGAYECERAAQPVIAADLRQLRWLVG